MWRRYASLYQPENLGIVRFINSVVCRAYCDRIVKLSDCLQALPRSSVCNVHGVRAEFIGEGTRRAAKRGKAPFEHGAYFIGKLLWAKGHRLLIDYLSGEEPGKGKRRTAIDIFGDGEDRSEIVEAASQARLEMNFCGGRDHADPAIRGYKVFVNPSQTEVLSTTTAEALAMGKFVVIEVHPSNEFFYRFPNALTYSTPAEFRHALTTALASTPAPLTPEESRALSWAGGTERFLSQVESAAAASGAPSLTDEITHMFHLMISGWDGYIGDALRTVVYESGPISRQRWLHKERKWRRCTDPAMVVEKSCKVAPPAMGQSWAERYSEGASGSWTSVFKKKQKE